MTTEEPRTGMEREQVNMEDNGPFWWMSDAWHEDYWTELDLARVASMQAGVSLSLTCLRHPTNVPGCEPTPWAAYLDPGHKVGHRRGLPIQAQGL